MLERSPRKGKKRMRIATQVRPREGAWLWLAKVLSGVMVFALLIVHLVVNHMVAQGGLLSYGDVIAYYANPIIPVMEGVFLVFVVTHALLGVRGIILDLNPSRAVMYGLDVILSGIGAVAIVYGIWLLRVLALRAGG
jgi:succinate dehydrogenase / fumarate reductase membrane anchor subunit